MVEALPGSMTPCQPGQSFSPFQTDAEEQAGHGVHCTNADRGAPPTWPLVLQICGRKAGAVLPAASTKSIPQFCNRCCFFL